MRVAQDLLARYEYVGAAKILEEAAARFASDATIEKLQRWLSLCRAFDAWDRFDHVTALKLIEPYRGQLVQHAVFLDAVVNGRGAHGFELVEDLLLNAQRRAAQGRFDDAVGRLYRALELTAQRWLEMRYGIRTGDVEINLVPESVKDKLHKAKDEEGTVRIGLMKAWEVIAAFPGDQLGAIFKAERGAVMNFLGVRNQSLFAHGATPIGELDYQKHAPVVEKFTRSAMGEALAILHKKRLSPLPQLPTEWS